MERPAEQGSFRSLSDSADALSVVLPVSLLHCFPYSLEDILLAAVNISLVIPDDIAFAVNHEYVGYVVDTKLTLELAVGVKKHFIVPAFTLYEGLYLLGVLSLVDAHGDYLYAGLILPVLIDFMDGLQLALTGLTPGGEEADHHRLSVVAELGGVHGIAVDVVEHN